jgi:hypothetical protein
MIYKDFTPSQCVLIKNTRMGGIQKEYILLLILPDVILFIDLNLHYAV